MDRPWDASINFRRALDDIPAPVYYASLLGLDQVLHDIINSEQLEGTTIPALSLRSTSNLSKKNQYASWNIWQRTAGGVIWRS